jgi:hypothetical protein
MGETAKGGQRMRHNSRFRRLCKRQFRRPPIGGCRRNCCPTKTCRDRHNRTDFLAKDSSQAVRQWTSPIGLEIMKGRWQTPRQSDARSIGIRLTALSAFQASPTVLHLGPLPPITQRTGRPTRQASGCGTSRSSPARTAAARQPSRSSESSSGDTICCASTSAIQSPNARASRIRTAWSWWGRGSGSPVAWGLPPSSCQRKRDCPPYGMKISRERPARSWPSPGGIRLLTGLLSLSLFAILFMLRSLPTTGLACSSAGRTAGSFPWLGRAKTARGLSRFSRERKWDCPPWRLDVFAPCWAAPTTSAGPRLSA